MSPELHINTMKATLAVTALCFFVSEVASAPKTLTSTLTLIPVPLSRTPSAHQPPPAYPTGLDTGQGTGTAAASGTSGPLTANYTFLSITLHYRTTLQTQRVYPNLTQAGNPFSQHPKATNISPPIFNNTGVPTPRPKDCTLNGIYCDSPTTFSVCIPAAGNSTTYYSIGSVANGTVCVSGRIERASDRSILRRAL